MFKSDNITSDAGPQYRCGRVGRGVQPPSILKHTQKCMFSHFLTWSPWTDGPTDGQSLPQSCVSATKNKAASSSKSCFETSKWQLFPGWQNNRYLTSMYLCQAWINLHIIPRQCSQYTFMYCVSLSWTSPSTKQLRETDEDVAGSRL